MNQFRFILYKYYRFLKKKYIKFLKIIKPHRKIWAIYKYLVFVFTSKRDSQVTFLIGDCGAGKSSYAVRIAQKEMQKGFPVYSNMPIKGSIQWDINDFMVYDIEKNATIIIDEASSKGLASRGESHKKSNTDNVIEGFTMYRHYHIRNIIVIAPSFADVVPIVRSRTTKCLYIQNSLLKIFGVGMFKIVKKHVDIPDNNSEPKEFFSFIPLYRGFYLQYPTFEMFDSFSRKRLKIKKWETW